MQNNIDKFNYYVGCIFAILHEEFPCRSQLDTPKIVGCEKCPETIDAGGRWTGLYMYNGEVQNMTKELEFVYETANWLFETGYLIGSIGMTSHGRSAFVTLSPKGLEILKVIPTSIDDSKAKVKPIGEELSEAFNSAAKEKVADIASQALSYMFKIGWDTLSGS